MAAQNERVIVKVFAPAALEATLAKPLIDGLAAVRGIEVTTDELNNEIEIILDVKAVGSSTGDNQLFVVQTLVRSREVSNQLTARLMTNDPFKKIPGSLKAARDIWWVPIIRHEVIRPTEWAEKMKALVEEFSRVVVLSPIARQLMH